MSKKASANMWWIIIGAVLALVVMVILMTIFTNKVTRVDSGLLGCASNGGTCEDKGGCQTKGGTVSKTFECSKEKQECCFGVKSG